jgi:hypothetical protein
LVKGAFNFAAERRVFFSYRDHYVGICGERRARTNGWMEGNMICMRSAIYKKLSTRDAARGMIRYRKGRSKTSKEEA